MQSSSKGSTGGSTYAKDDGRVMSQISKKRLEYNCMKRTFRITSNIGAQLTEDGTCADGSN